MMNYLPAFKNAVIKEFYQLFEQYADDEIYGCALVLSPYLAIEHLTISTKRSLFQENEDAVQYLDQNDKWNVKKWRYRSNHTAHDFLPIQSFLTEYLKKTQIFGNPLLIHNNMENKNNLDLLIDTFYQAKQVLSDNYGIDVRSILFFISIPNQIPIEIASAKKLNIDSVILTEFLAAKAPPVPNAINEQRALRIKLSQQDKDLLLDLAQIIQTEHFDYLEIAHDAYVMTLEPSFVDCNIYIQKLISNIAAMDSQSNAVCALNQDEILKQIRQLYPAI
jgi:hypothetical protein